MEWLTSPWCRTRGRRRHDAFKTALADAAYRKHLETFDLDDPTGAAQTIPSGRRGCGWKHGATAVRWGSPSSEQLLRSGAAATPRPAPRLDQALTRAARNTGGDRFTVRSTSARCWRSRTASSRRNSVALSCGSLSISMWVMSASAALTA